jgi:hypothetical protein
MPLGREGFVMNRFKLGQRCARKDCRAYTRGGSPEL